MTVNHDDRADQYACTAATLDVTPFAWMAFGIWSESRGDRSEFLEQLGWFCVARRYDDERYFHEARPT